MMHSSPRTISSEDIRLGRYEAREFAPSPTQIPEAFNTAGNAWSAAASHLMWIGSAAIISAQPKPGIDLEPALLHVAAVLHAVDLTIEHREAAAAYLLATWFESIELTDGIVAPEAAKPAQESLVTSPA